MPLQGVPYMTYMIGFLSSVVVAQLPELSKSFVFVGKHCRSKAETLLGFGS